MENNILDSDLFEMPSMGFSERVQQILDDGFDFSIGDCLTEAFDIFKQNVGGFLGFTVLLIGLNLLPNLMESSSDTTGLIMSGILNIAVGFISIPLGVGPALVAKKIYHKEPYEFNDFFGGFKHFNNLLIAAILMMLAVMVGFFLFLIPGIYLAIAFSWAYFMVIFPGLTSVDALSTSRKIIHKNWFKVFLFGLALILVAIAGLFACGIGLFIAIPLISIAQYVAYEKVIGANLH